MNFGVNINKNDSFLYIELSTARNWFHHLDTLVMKKRQKWEVRIFCSWTMYGCIREETLVDLPVLTKAAVTQKKDSLFSSTRPDITMGWIF